MYRINFLYILWAGNKFKQTIKFVTNNFSRLLVFCVLYYILNLFKFGNLVLILINLPHVALFFSLTQETKSWLKNKVAPHFLINVLKLTHW